MAHRVISLPAEFGRYRCIADSGKPSAGRFMGSRPSDRELALIDPNDFGAG
jgi:hypothetical protein